MKNPWTDCDNAYDVMFCDYVEVKSHGIKTTIECSVFPVEDTVPFIDGSLDTPVKTYNILIKKESLKLPYKIQIGDSVYCDYTDTKVEDIKEEQHWYRLTTRGKTK